MSAAHVTHDQRAMPRCFAGMAGAMDGARALFAVRPPWWDLGWLVPSFLSTHPTHKQRKRELRQRAHAPRV